MKLRSVELEVPQSAAAAQFMRDVWGLFDAGTRGKTTFLRATGVHPSVLSLTEAATPALTAITFSASQAELDAIAARVAATGRAAPKRFGTLDEPGGGSGILVDGPEGQVYRFITGDKPVAPIEEATKPIQVTHAVLNSTDRDASARFAAEVLGFRLSDRTRGMSFMRCDDTHHSMAYAASDGCSLHHIAFEMTDLDAVMNGAGRMREAGYQIAWGPGRHGPGNNVFTYFIAPFGATIEYTSEIQRVDDSYRTGQPEDWTWPPGRVDHWGLSKPDAERMHVAERLFRFRPMAA